MKKESGITLISVTIYVLVMAIVVGIIATISSFFYNNVTNVKDSGQNAAEYDKFNMFFLEDTKAKGNKIREVAQDGSYIVFENGNQYTFQDNSIYQNQVRICKNIVEASFKVKTQYDKTIVSVYLQIGENSEFTKTTDYTITPTPNR